MYCLDNLISEWSGERAKSDRYLVHSEHLFDRRDTNTDPFESRTYFHCNRTSSDNFLPTDPRDTLERAVELRQSFLPSSLTLIASIPLESGLTSALACFRVAATGGLRRTVARLRTVESEGARSTLCRSAKRERENVNGSSNGHPYRTDRWIRSSPASTSNSRSVDCIGRHSGTDRSLSNCVRTFLPDILSERCRRTSLREKPLTLVAEFPRQTHSAETMSRSRVARRTVLTVTPMDASGSVPTSFTR